MVAGTRVHLRARVPLGEGGAPSLATEFPANLGDHTLSSEGTRELSPGSTLGSFPTTTGLAAVRRSGRFEELKRETFRLRSETRGWMYGIPNRGVEQPGSSSGS